jgi:pilus assembly protein Flp/PilA
MNKFMNALRNFARDEEGAQVVEYALIIAVVSIALVIALANLAGQGGANPFQDFIDRVTVCLTGAVGACV